AALAGLHARSRRPRSAAQLNGWASPSAQGSPGVGASPGAGATPALKRMLLAGLERALREAVEVALDRELRPVVGLRDRAERHEERREVLDGRVSVRHPRRLLAEREQLVEVAPFERLGRPAVEVDRPLRRAWLSEEVLVDERQAVGQEAAADD